MYETLVEIKNILSTIPDINSVKIGLESNLSHNDCPFIRVIAQPSRPNEDNFREIEIEVEIAYGEKINIRDKDLESIYQKIYETEKIIKDKLDSIGARWQVTIPDGDRLTNIKVSAIMFNLTISSC